MNKEQKTTFGSVLLTVIAGAALLFGAKVTAGFILDHLALVTASFALLVALLGAAFLSTSSRPNHSEQSSRNRATRR